MAGIAALDGNDVSRFYPRRCAAGRNPIKGWVEDGWSPAELNRDTMGQIRLVTDRHRFCHCRDVGHKCIGIGAIFIVDKIAASLGGCLYRRRIARIDGRNFLSIYVGLPCGTRTVDGRNELGNREPDVATGKVDDGDARSHPIKALGVTLVPGQLPSESIRVSFPNRIASFRST